MYLPSPLTALANPLRPYIDAVLAAHHAATGVAADAVHAATAANPLTAPTPPAATPATDPESETR